MEDKKYTAREKIERIEIIMSGAFDPIGASIRLAIYDVERDMRKKQNERHIKFERGRRSNNEYN